MSRDLAVCPDLWTRHQHLLSYSIDAYWGHNGFASGIVSDSYAAHVDAEGPHLWSGVANSWRTSSWLATCNCAHTFILGAWKRTIDGYGPILYKQSSQSLTLRDVPGQTLSFE